MIDRASFSASRVTVAADVDYGEGYIHFEWPDPIYGSEGLTIDLVGFCSRNMSIRSGAGPPDFVELRPGSVTLRFTSVLAKKLELHETIQIQFSISEDDFRALQQVVEYFKEWPS